MRETDIAAMLHAVEDSIRSLIEFRVIEYFRLPSIDFWELL